MAASTITRDTWTNDTGSFSAPNGDGTVLNNSVLQNNIYARIDAMFAGTGTYATFTLGGLLTAEGFGSHTFTASGSGVHQLIVRNTSAGTTNSASVVVGNNTSLSLGFLAAYSSLYTPSTYSQSSGVALYAGGVGGLSVIAADAAGMIRWYSGGTTERMRLHASGGFSVNTASDPGVNNMLVSSTFSVNLLGSHAFSASGTGANTLNVTNTAAGTTNLARLTVGNDSDGSLTILQSLSSTYTSSTFNQANGSILYAAGAGGLSIATNNAAGVIRFYSGSGTERARFISSGEFCVNRTGAVGTGLIGIAADSASQSGLTIISTNVANALNYAVFYNSVAGIAGSIAQTGATTVAYNTTSDARLKIDGGRVKDLAELRAVIIHDFTWTDDGRRDRGVFAQEAVTVFPRAITPGSDNEMTLDGKTPMKPWMANYQAFIPDLVAGWQDHDTTITSLLARIAKLEGPVA